MSLTVAPQPSDVVEQQARGAARTDAERQTMQRASSKGWPQAALQEFEWQVGGKLQRHRQVLATSLIGKEMHGRLQRFAGRIGFRVQSDRFDFRRLPSGKEMRFTFDPSTFHRGKPRAAEVGPWRSPGR